MSRHTIPARFAPVLTLAALAAASGCDGGAPWTDPETGATPAARQDLGPRAAYDRRLIFVTPERTTDGAAIFDFQALSDSAAVHRGARVRLLAGGEWVPLLDSGWRIEPIREPWRLIPHGPLRMIMSEAGDVEALEVRGGSPVRLEPGTVLAEHAPDGGTQILLRRATLTLPGGASPGLLLDLQLGRTVGAGFRPAAAPPGGAGAEGGGQAATASPAGNAAASPTARPGTEALLVGSDGYAMVIAASAEGDLAWVHVAGQDDVLRGMRMAPLIEDAEPGARALGSWQLLTPGGEVVGQLRAAAQEGVALASPRAEILGHVAVSGWIEDRSVRREVFGIVRHVR